MLRSVIFLAGSSAALPPPGFSVSIQGLFCFNTRAFLLHPSCTFALHGRVLKEVFPSFKVLKPRGCVILRVEFASRLLRF